MPDTISDSDVRAAFAPLRESTPSTAEFAALRARAASRPPARRRQRRVVLVAGLAAIGVAVAALPTGDVRPGGAAGVLRATAAVAADQPGPSAFTGFRYAQTRARWTFGTSTATVTIEQPQETWIGADWRGTRRAQAGRVVARTGDISSLEAVAGRTWLARPSTEPLRFGDGPLAHVPLAQLPTAPERLGPLLDAATRDGRWSSTRVWRLVPYGSDPDAAVRYMVARQVLVLLTVANATPELRSGLFGVLARMPNVVSTGERTDARGRRGQGVEIRFAADARGPLPAEPDGTPIGGPNAARPETIRAIFDPATSDVLTWSVGKDLRLAPPGSAPGEHPQLLGEEHVILRTAHVFRAGDRPSR